MILWYISVQCKEHIDHLNMLYKKKDGWLLIMKKIEIIVPDRQLDTVSGILKDNNIGGMNHYRIQGKGNIKAEPVSVGRGTMQYTPEFIPRTKIETVVKDEMVDTIVKSLLDSLSNKIGGKIFITDIQETIDIRTKSRGDSAL